MRVVETIRSLFLIALFICGTSGLAFAADEADDQEQAPPVEAAPPADAAESDGDADEAEVDEEPEAEE